ncbi:hypothetical protein [Cupriavidus sp. AcVe19-6a]|uniref:hypothetical protein n=1 Tax=Cupriavidus sp. AcVe19-6a TaxID=2821358 RepID=UPI001AE1C22F|nr:hypothetical protein [Cupriavidus sp. AcVe19-6a]MBP0635187.1 hypothetical protein [Cupriavidus sp. AcVe19-6a]
MPIQLAFQNEKLRQICESSVSAKRRLGEEAARSLRTRLADLRASASPVDMVDLGFAVFDAGSDIQIFVYIDGGYAVTATVNNRPEPRLEDGQLDWKRVTRLKILSIEGANEN